MRPERGFILPMVIFSLAIMGVLVWLMVGTSGDDRLGSRYDFEGARSFYAAEAGVDTILSSWKAGGYEGAVPNPGNSSDLGWRDLAGNGGRYRTSILKVENSTYLITVDGQSPGARKGLRTIQVMLTPGVTFSYAALGANDVQLGGHATTDSWDSNLGSYATSNCGVLAVPCDGDVRSDGTISQLGGTSYIGGDATATTSIQGGCPDPSHIEDACQQGQSPVAIPTVSCPVGFSPAADLGTLPPSVTYNATSGDLDVGSSANLVLAYANTPYRFHNVSVGGSAQITFTGTEQHVDIYVSATLNLGGRGIVNPQARPTDISIWGCGSSTTTWQVAGGSSAYFALYAPTHALQVGGSGSFYGALVGASILDGGGASIHYDAALSREPSIILNPGSWTEITR